jgi:hypothetical protein
MDESDKFELFARRLIDDVKPKIESKIFSHYRKVGYIVITVLGLVGVTIGWPALMGIIKTEIAEQIKQQVYEPVNKAKKTAAKAKKIADETLIGLNAKQSFVHNSIARLGLKHDDAAINIERTGLQIKKANNEIRRLFTSKNEMLALTKYLRSQVQTNPINRQEFTRLEKLIGDVASQTSKLAAALNVIQTDQSEITRIKITEESLKTLAALQDENVEKANADLKDVRKTSMAFIQFAGGRRKDIENASEFLRADGWKVPPEQRISLAAGKNEIRYYFKENEDAAKELRNDLIKSLEKAGIAVAKFSIVKLNPNHFKTKPAHGVLEVWVEIPPRRN